MGVFVAKQGLLRVIWVSSCLSGGKWGSVGAQLVLVEGQWGLVGIPQSGSLGLSGGHSNSVGVSGAERRSLELSGVQCPIFIHPSIMSFLQNFYAEV